MGQAMTNRFAGLGAGSARLVLATAASVAVAAIALVLLGLGIASGEVVATVLFLPVFVAALYGGRPAGFVAAAGALTVYVAARRADLEAAGAANAVALAVTRGVAYGVAAHIGARARALTDGLSGSASPAPSARPGRSGGGRRPPAAARAAERGFWDESEAAHAGAADRTEPVLAGVGAGPGGGGSYGRGDGYEEPYGAAPASPTMSNAWPPPPPGPSRGDPGRGGTGWSQGRDEAVDDDWDAVQESWRRQHGLPPEDPPAGDRWRAAAEDESPWGPPARPDTGEWSVPVTGPAPGPDAWGPPPGGPGWAAPPPAPDPRPAPADRWGGPGGDAWPSTPPGPAGTTGEHWAHEGPGQVGPWSRGGASTGEYGASGPASPAGPPTGEHWAAGPGGPPAGEHWAGGPGGGPPTGEHWAAGSAGPPTGEHWAAGSAGPPTGEHWAGGRSTGEHFAAGGPPTGEHWAAGSSTGEHRRHGGPPTGEHRVGRPADDPWAALAPQEAGDWPAPAPPPAGGAGDWPGPPPTSGEMRHAADAPGWPSGPEAWPSPPAVGVPGWAPPGPAAGVAGSWAAGMSGGRPAEPQPPLPAVDPETGLWTAKFLRDRLASERARSGRSRRPFSLVLVQVPDAPLAALPYRRQLTLLRELGYQFVAGGVVEHLVHVPDREQHWFAVILPDTDRSGAQVLERRLRLGIGGYLSSRGLRLADLQSASLTAPDDDPAMGAIWDALIGPDEADDPAFAHDR
jgi:hypothetical protein